MLYHNGTTWVGYADSTAYPTADPEGPIVSASMPIQQSDGSALVTGDLWISTADLENYPTVYRYNVDISGTAAQKWGSPLDQVTKQQKMEYYFQMHVMVQEREQQQLHQAVLFQHC